MAKQNGLIPTGEALKGKKLAFNIKSQREIEVVGRQTVDFGSLLDLKTTLLGKDYPLTGWLGANGKTLPVVAEFNAAPAKSKKDESKEAPAFRVFTEVEGEVIEVAVAFRKTAKESGKDFYTGFTTGTPKHDLTFFKHEPKAKAE